MSSALVLEAPAKINLYLEVGQRRPDGFHDVRSVMQTVELCDSVEIELSGGSGVRMEVEGEAPSGGDNLCVRAVEAFFSRRGRRSGLDIRLTKRIPAAAGLGGGSSDAAAVLRGLSLLFEKAMDRGELLALAASIGSDVPFFLIGGTVLAGGRGDLVFPLVQAPPLPIELANPGIGISTALVYERFDAIGGGEAPERGIEALIDCLGSQRIDCVPELLHNGLQRASLDLVPDSAELIRVAEQAGAARAIVSGSGPSIFAIPAEGKAESLHDLMRQAAPWAVSTSFRSSGVTLLKRW